MNTPQTVQSFRKTEYGFPWILRVKFNLLYKDHIQYIELIPKHSPADIQKQIDLATNAAIASVLKRIGIPQNNYGKYIQEIHNQRKVKVANASDELISNYIPWNKWKK